MRAFPRMDIADGVTEEQKKQLFGVILAVKEGHIQAACESVGVSRRKYRQWLDEDPRFAEECQDVMEGLIDLTQSMLVRNIKHGESRDIQFMLKTQGRHRGYGEKVEHEHTGMIGHAHFNGHYPPEPETLAEWEAQVTEARRLRQERENKSAKGPNKDVERISPADPAATLNTGSVSRSLALVPV